MSAPNPKRAAAQESEKMEEQKKESKIESAIERASESLQRSSIDQPLHPETKRTVRDASQVLEDTQEILMERNKGEELEKIVRAGRKLSDESPEVREEIKRLENEMDLSQSEKEQLRTEASRGVQAAGNLITELIRSTEFRNIFVDVVQLLNDILVQNLQENISGETVESKIEEGARSAGPGEAKEKVHEAREQLEVDLTSFNVKISKEQREQLRKRFHRIVDNLAHNRHFNHVMQSLFVLFEELSHYAEFWRRQVEKDIQSTLRRMYVQQVWRETKNFIEEFTGEHSVDHLIDSVKVFSQMLSDDEELKNYFRDLKAHVSEMLQEPQRLQDKVHEDTVNELIDRGRRIMSQEEYRREINTIFKESSNIIYLVRTDPLIQNLASDLRRLLRDVTTDSHGNLQFKPETLGELKNVLVPLIINQLENVPIKPIVQTTESVDYIIDHILFSGQDILPAQVLIESAMNLEMGIRPEMTETPSGKKTLETSKPTEAMTGIRIFAKDMRANLKDVQVWYHRKAFPEIEDTCKLDLNMGETGADLSLLLEVQNPQTHPLFRLHSANCTIHELNINVTESSSNWLYNVLTSVFKRWIRSSIEDGVEKRLKRFFFALNEQLEQIVRAQSSEIGSMLKEKTKFTEEIKSETRMHA
eukprot:gb/GECH01007940.1/.p1 GENE.gb/GECH01007940.1/~~gb/GECH01007940.1/.p1  ORF type:complete len:645 (+),score=214.98 gb/GECH01007940.1/:1-1935(+)